MIERKGGDEGRRPETARTELGGECRDVGRHAQAVIARTVAGRMAAVGMVACEAA